MCARPKDLSIRGRCVNSSLREDYPSMLMALYYPGMHNPEDIVQTKEGCAGPRGISLMAFDSWRRNQPYSLHRKGSYPPSNLIALLSGDERGES